MQLFQHVAKVRDARDALRFELNDLPGITLEFLDKLLPRTSARRRRAFRQALRLGACCS